MRHGVTTTSHDDETCSACANAIPAGQWYVLSWLGQAEDTRREHLDCAAPVRMLRLSVGG